MDWNSQQFPHIRKMTPDYERIIERSPLLNIDNLVVPTPYVQDKGLEVDYEHSLIWQEEGEVLACMLVYATQDRKALHIYKIVTSPFGRSKGIGTGFFACLAHTVAPDTNIYLYVWEKLLSSIDFFTARGFCINELIVFRRMRFYHMSVSGELLQERTTVRDRPEISVIEELSRVRHDVKKSLTVLADMAAMLSVDNFNRVAEDMNRESTAMLNTLNRYEDNVHLAQKVSFKELLVERVIPFIEAVDNNCEVIISLNRVRIDTVNISYIACSRALINIVSNALEAINDTDRPGRIEISLNQVDDTIILTIRDNGIGISADRLQKGDDRIPLFVGHSTKNSSTPGEGVGTRQIYATFGIDNIEVTSDEGQWTSWNITMAKSTSRNSTLLDDLSSRYVRMIMSTHRSKLTLESNSREITIFIWQLRQMELFCYELLYHYSRYNNIRDVFQNILMYRFGKITITQLREELAQCRIDDNSIRLWVLGICRRINKFENCILKNVDFQKYKDVMFQSYGQVEKRTIIFTLDPDNGRFYACDRKLAEHVDFVPYLERQRDELLRGELVGDVRNTESPIYLGVWSVKDRDDLYAKFKLIRQGARQLLQMGLKMEKRIAFYDTTYSTSDCEIDTLKSITLGKMAELAEEDFDQYIRPADDELSGILAFD